MLARRRTAAPKNTDKERISMTIDNINKHVLLNGAGLSHNFGAPLAKEMWSLIFNSNQVQMFDRLRDLLLTDFDYESIYYTVINGNYSDEEKKALTNAVVNAYSKIDSIIKSWQYNSDNPLAFNIYKFQSFIERFYKQDKNSFIFTLNQDLLLERLYYNGSKPVIPGFHYNTDIYFSTIFDSEVHENPFLVLPSNTEIDQIALEITSTNRFNYIKLHGSSNWKTSNDETRMVIGYNKESQISKEPLLSLYFEVFKTVLSTPNIKLLVCGYSFSDKHINDIIVDNYKNNHLSLYVLNPQDIAIFQKNILEKENGDSLWQSIRGYFPYDMKSLFPYDQSTPCYFDILEENYFR